MCGIAGIIELRQGAGSRIDDAVCRAMTDRLVHRGPDDGDVYRDERIALGHRRLSIIDVAAGHQPMFNEDGSVCVVFNGEIYNFQSVTAELEALGHRFKTRSDTEIIVHGWEQWGVDCLKRFRGMFAFVLWDQRQRRVFIARDRLGVKPLYYALLPSGQFLFASELKAFDAHPGFRRRIDDQAVASYLALGYVPEPLTIYAGACKLPAAHYLLLELDEDRIEPRRYWQIDYNRKLAIDAVEAERELDRLLRESVQLRMISEVPLGAFLSGGVDSSVVVATMAALDPGSQVVTCSIGFDVKAYDESAYAQTVADHLNTRHLNRTVTVDDLSLIERLPEIFDEPFSDSSALATYRVCEIARERVTVSLSGDGGDEAFGGYRRYRLHVAEDGLRSALPTWLRKGILGPLGTHYPRWGFLPRPLRAGTMLQALANTPTQAYFRAMSAIPADLLASISSPEHRRRVGNFDPLSHFERASASFSGSPDSFDLIQHIDLQTWLPGDINVKADRTSMAHSLEVREPLLDHVMMEWAASLPQSMKISPTGAKVILKNHARRVVPASVIDRPKQGFSVPMDRWFKGPLAERLQAVLRSDGLAGYLDSQGVARMLEQHARGARNHDRALWTVFCLGNFLSQRG